MAKIFDEWNEWVVGKIARRVLTGLGWETVVSIDAQDKLNEAAKLGK